MKNGDSIYDNELIPLTNINLKINTHSRMSTRPGSYYRIVQPYQHYSGSITTNTELIHHNSLKYIYAYSFCLNQDKGRPSGFLQFANKDVILKFEYSKQYNNTDSANFVLVIIGEKLNVIRISSGIADII